MKKHKQKHTVTIVSTVFDYTCAQLFCKYNSTSLTYYIKKIDELIFNDPTIYSAYFKEYLLYNDGTEFLRRFYSHKELPNKLKHILSFYHKYSRIYPNYTIMEGSKYLYKNIQKKQKMIDNLQEIKRQENYNKAHPSNIHNILSHSALSVILNESNSFYSRNVYQLFNINPMQGHKRLNANDSVNDIDKIVNAIERVEDNIHMRLRNISPKVPKHNNIILKPELSKIYLNNNNNSCNSSNNKMYLHLLYKSSSLSNLNKATKNSTNIFNKNNNNNTNISSHNNSRGSNSNNNHHNSNTNNTNNNNNNANKIKLFSPRYVNHKSKDIADYLIKNKLVLHHKINSQTFFPSPISSNHKHKETINSIDNDNHNNNYKHIKRSGITEHLRVPSSFVSSPSINSSNRNNSNEQYQRNNNHNSNVYNNRNINNNNMMMFGTSSFNRNKSMLNICRIKTPKNEFLTERYNVNKRFVYFCNNNNKKHKVFNNNNNVNNELSPITKMKRTIGTSNGNRNNSNNTKKSNMIETKQDELKNKYHFQNYKNAFKKIYVQYN